MNDKSLIEQAAKRLEELRRSRPVEANGKSAFAESGSFAPVATPGVVRSQPTRAAQERSESVDIDLTYLAAAGFITPNAPRTRIADEFRILKRPLIANASDRGAQSIRNGNLIMVTSAVPGEGKTLCAINLAMSIALELDRTVLLVDADVARPSLPKYLGVQPRRGLLDVLDHSSLDLSQVLLRTNVEKLTLLTSGGARGRATELLASASMARLLDEMANRYADRIVIFDSPPLLAATESQVLATQMGQIVLVVHAESTSQSEVGHAIAAIESCPVKMLVLNQVKTAGQGAFGYGYGYGYGYGADSRKG